MSEASEASRASYVRYAWVAGRLAGRIGHTAGSPRTLQNCLALIRHEFPDAAIECNTRDWFPIALLSSALPAGTRERNPEFCPVYHGDELVAVLLR